MRCFTGGGCSHHPQLGWKDSTKFSLLLLWKMRWVSEEAVVNPSSFLFDYSCWLTLSSCCTEAILLTKGARWLLPATTASTVSARQGTMVAAAPVHGERVGTCTVCAHSRSAGTTCPANGYRQYMLQGPSVDTTGKRHFSCASKNSGQLIGKCPTS